MCSCLQMQEETRSSGERCCTSEPIHPLPPYKNMVHDLSIIGRKLYVMRAGLIKIAGFVPSVFP